MDDIIILWAALCLEASIVCLAWMVWKEFWLSWPMRQERYRVKLVSGEHKRVFFSPGQWRELVHNQYEKKGWTRCGFVEDQGDGLYIAHMTRTVMVMAQ